VVINSLLSISTLAADCKFAANLNEANSEAVNFVKDSSFALHLQLTNENFSSQNALNARSKIFDTVLDTPYWSRKFNNMSEFKIFWNWVRFQYWGLLQQQALLKEDQGFRVSPDSTLTDNFNSILKFPIYPYPYLDQDYQCTASEKLIYSCNQKIIKVDVLLSPALACSNKMDTNAFRFTYLVTKSAQGWTILDVKFKGRNLVSDSFNEFDNLLNRYGKDKALNYLKFLINKVPLIDPISKPEQNGSVVFNKIYKVATPKYPIEY
jgi:hypothetical protein